MGETVFGRSYESALIMFASREPAAASKAVMFSENLSNETLVSDNLVCNGNQHHGKLLSPGGRKRNLTSSDGFLDGKLPLIFKRPLGSEKRGRCFEGVARPPT